MGTNPRARNNLKMDYSVIKTQNQEKDLFDLAYEQLSVRTNQIKEDYENNKPAIVNPLGIDIPTDYEAKIKLNLKGSGKILETVPLDWNKIDLSDEVDFSIAKFNIYQKLLNTIKTNPSSLTDYRGNNYLDMGTFPWGGKLISMKIWLDKNLKQEQKPSGGILHIFDLDKILATLPDHKILGPNARLEFADMSHSLAQGTPLLELKINPVPGYIPKVPRAFAPLLENILKNIS